MSLAKIINDTDKKEIFVKAIAEDFAEFDADVKKMDAEQHLDPRHFDMAEDSELWTRLITQAQLINKELAANLQGMRSFGTRIRKTDKGNYVLRPEIDLQGHTAWLNQAEYDCARDRWLKPYTAQIVELLARVRQHTEVQIGMEWL